MGTFENLKIGSQKGESSSPWGAHRVELATWSYAMLLKHDPEKLKRSLSSKRKKLSDEDEVPPRKKRT